MLKRKAYEALIKWKNESKGSSALLIEGARRVGKSTLAVEFGRKEYKSMIVIDFSTVDDSVKELFRTLRNDLDRFFQYLQTIHQTTLYPRDSLLVFDEIQTFPIARAFIKQLVADGRYDYIETGSLLSIKQNIADIVLPSEEEAMRLNPMDFEEFLWAMNEERLAEDIRSAFAKAQPLPDVLHKRASRLLREYMLVGGMPHIVELYSQTKSFEECDQQKRRILTLYRNDIGRFAVGYQDKVMSVLDEVPSQLSTHEKRFNVSSLAKDARMRTYEEAFFWLSDAQITNPCFAAAEPTVGLTLNRKRATIKCYMADTGLLTTLALQNGVFTQEELYKNVLLGKVDLNEGMLVENLVAQTLTANGDRLFFYSQSYAKGVREKMEVDFLVVRPFADAAGKMRVSPIEVKSGSNYRTVSLDRFTEKFKDKVGCQWVVHPGQLRKENRKTYVPLYMAHLI